MGAFLHAVRVFGEHLAAVHWSLLVLALGFHLVRLVLRAIAWRTILRAAHPGARLRLRSVFGAYVAGVGVNSVAPARGGDVVKLYLIRQRLSDSSYATLAPTLIAETVFDFFVAAALLGWALSIGVLPTHQVYSRLPTVDWKFFLRHEQATAIGLLVLFAATIIGLALFAEHGGELQRRFKRGFAVFGNRRLLLFGVVLPQALSWVFRFLSVYEFLRAFGVPASVHNALLDGGRLARDALPGDAGRGRYETRADRVRIPQHRHLEDGAARLQRRPEHRADDLQPRPRRRGDPADGAHAVLAASAQPARDRARLTASLPWPAWRTRRSTRS